VTIDAPPGAQSQLVHAYKLICDLSGESSLAPLKALSLIDAIPSLTMFCVSPILGPCMIAHCHASTNAGDSVRIVSVVRLDFCCA
jgi:hypothetical protein